MPEILLLCYECIQYRLDVIENSMNDILLQLNLPQNKAL